MQMYSILLNIDLEKVVRKVIMDHVSVKLGETNIGLLAYVDNIILMTNNKV